ncbi:MAG TPA: TMEM175 family protein, partial [Steroidobacteraceae bacterium]
MPISSPRPRWLTPRKRQRRRAAEPPLEHFYNQIAGGALERLAALSDGVFAFAMTLLVLDIRVPAMASVHSERELLQGLALLLPRFIMYAMSFLTLGIFWVGQQTQLNQLERADRDLAWIHIGFLAAVAILPFSTMLLAEFIEYRTALLIYWGNLAFLGMVLYAAWRYAVRARLLQDGTAPQVAAAIDRRILVAQSLYAAGAALCLINTYCSIAFIFLVQLNYAFAPRFRRPR